MAKVAFDYADIRAEMIRKNMKIYELSKISGIGLTTLTQKLKHGTPFSGEQIYAMAGSLGISPADIGHYFFRVKV